MQLSSQVFGDLSFPFLASSSGIGGPFAHHHKDTPMKNLMTIKEFQQAYSLSRSTVYRLVKRGNFPFVRVGRAVRIRRVDADNWFAGLGSGPEVV